jgi:hypothetical protein
MVGRQLPFFSVIVPFWLIWAQAGWRGMKEVWPACLITGGSFGITQFVVSNYHGPWLVDIVGAFVSMGALVLFMRVWKPRRGHRSHPAAAASTGDLDHAPALPSSPPSGPHAPHTAASREGPCHLPPHKPRLAGWITVDACSRVRLPLGTAGR